MGGSKDAYIQVKAWEEKGKAHFELESRHKGPNRGNEEELVFQSLNGEDWTMVFIIQSNDLDLRFAPDKMDAFWVSRTECPKTPSYDSEFVAKRVSGELRRLVVVNRNHIQCDYFFTLNFTSNIGPLQYDPIIKNLNGGGMHGDPDWDFGDVLSVVVSAVGAIALIFGLGKLFGKWRR